MSHGSWPSYQAGGARQEGQGRSQLGLGRAQGLQLQASFPQPRQAHGEKEQGQFRQADLPAAANSRSSPSPTHADPNIRKLIFTEVSQSG